MRAPTIFALLCFIAAASCQSHDLIVGRPGYGDVIIYRTTEYKYGFPFFIRTSVIEYPEPGHYNLAHIKAIYVKDNEHDGSGGYPTISAGGIGQKFVKIKLKSQRGGGFNFTITIYGQY